MANGVPIRTMTLLPSATRTAATVSPDLRNTRHRGLRVVVDVTAVAATGQITVTIQGKSSMPGSADYYPLLVGAAVTAVGEQVLTVYPGVTETPNVDASVPLPSIVRVSVAVANAAAVAYSARGELLP